MHKNKKFFRKFAKNLKNHKIALFFSLILIPQNQNLALIALSTYENIETNKSYL